MHPTKISVLGAVILFFVKFLFHCSDNGFLSIWITLSYREQGECSAGNNSALVKKRGIKMTNKSSVSYNAQM